MGEVNLHNSIPNLTPGIGRFIATGQTTVKTAPSESGVLDWVLSRSTATNPPLRLHATRHFARSSFPERYMLFEDTLQDSSPFQTVRCHNCFHLWQDHMKLASEEF